jgi:hypothetical protein
MARGGGGGSVEQVIPAAPPALCATRSFTYATGVQRLSGVGCQADVFRNIASALPLRGVQPAVTAAWEAAVIGSGCADVSAAINGTALLLEAAAAAAAAAAR